MNAKCGKFVSGDATIPGLGFIPTAMIILGNYAGTWGPSKFSIGFDDGTFGVSYSCNGGPIDFLFQTEMGTKEYASILRFGNAGSELHTERTRAHFTALNPPTISWDILNDADGCFYYYMALGGCSAKVKQYVIGSPAVQAVTGIGFKPRGLLNFFSPLAPAIPYGGAPGTLSGPGFNTACNNQSCAIAASEPATAFTSSASSLSMQNIGFIGSSSRGYIQSYDSDGFTVNYGSSTPDSNLWYGCLALGGGIALNVGSFMGLSGLGTQTISIPGATPRGIFLASDNKASGTAFTPSVYHSTGFADEFGNQFSFCDSAIDAQAQPFMQATDYDLNHGYICIRATGNGTFIRVATAAITLIPNGISLNWTQNDGVARQINYCVFCENYQMDDCGVMVGAPGAGIYKMTPERPHDTLYI